MAQLSLYRRYRPRRFSEIRGQDHVVRALRNAVAGGTESHAYLFSGPRGTGKTSTARIFAKALNCDALAEGEPCGECESCLAMDAGRSFDLFELDAASNNGVDAVRELVERAAVGSPGRTKVYILDEVHMLTAAASNALLKTLEEPPDHVRFVLATTDPQKVLPTIRSRTQHYEFQLLSAEELEAYVRWIAADASLDLDDEAVAHVVRLGRGSARDTLSALDQVVAAGGVLVRSEPVEQLFDAIEAHDTAMAVTAVAEALAQGHDPRVLAEAFLGELRDAFLLSVGAGVPHLVSADRDRLAQRATSSGTAVLARAMESVGTALVDMRQSADPRIPLEVALVRLTSGVGNGGGADDAQLAALAARVDRLESRVREELGRRGDSASAPQREPAGPASAAPAPRSGDRATSTRATPPPPPRRPERDQSGPAAPVPAPVPVPAEDAPAASPAPAPAAETAPANGTSVASDASDAPPPAASPTPQAVTGGALPDRDAIVMAFGDEIVGKLKGIAKALYAAGRFVAVEDGAAVLALDNAPTRDRADQYRGEVEALLAAHFGTPVPLRLVTEQEAGRLSGGAGAGGAGGGGAGAPTPAPATGAQRRGGARSADAAGPAPRQEPAPEAARARSQRRPPPPPPRDRGPAAPADAAPRGGASTEPAPRTGPDPRPEPAPAPVAVAEPDDEEVIDLSELEDASAVATSGLDKLTAAFPGSELIEEGGDG